MKKVLLIDDDSAIHLIASAALQQTGAFDLGFARTGRQGLERARATRPDLILLDHMMPDIDGDEVILALREDEQLRDTPVLFVTAKGEQGVDYEGLGAQGLITKPFDPDKLANQIRAVLGMKEESAPVSAPPPVSAPAPGHDAFPSGGSVDELRRSFVRRGVKEIKHLMETVGPRFDIDAARRLAHLWIGRGGTLGHPRISLVARRLDLRLAEGWAPENRWRLQSDLRDVQQAFEEAWAVEQGAEDASAAESQSCEAPAIQAPPPGPLAAAMGAEPTSEPSEAAPVATESDPESPEDAASPTVPDADPTAIEVVSASVVSTAPAPEADVAVDIVELELASLDHEVPSTEPERRAEPLRPADLPEEVHRVLAGRVIGLFGFDHYSSEATREVLYTAGATVKPVELSARVEKHDEFGIDAAAVSVEAADADRAWALIDELLFRGIPTLIVGRGRQLLSAAPQADGCDVLLAPWSAEEVMLRCYRLLATASARMLLMGADEEPEAAAPPLSNDVVIADDDPTITALVEMTLREIGLECHVASGGQDALDLVESIRPGAVVLDVNMPQMNGFEVLAALRNGDETRSLPVVMLTALRQEADVIRGFRLGADDYVIKPFNPMELSARVERLIRRAG